MKTTNTGLGQMIYNLRENANMTRETLAEMLNVSSRTIYYWESDFEDRRPKLTALIKLAEIFNISFNNILV